MTALPAITSEILEPHFMHLIGARWAILSRPENLYKRDEEMHVILRTLGELASSAGATHAALVCSNHRRYFPRDCDAHKRLCEGKGDQ